MGKMIDGTWQRDGAVAVTKGGAFERPETSFRSHIGSPAFPAVSGRYHLYVSYACPWAHRALIFRQLKGLAPHIALSVTHWRMGEDGWTFDEADGTIPDPEGARALYDIYARAKPDYTGRVTVPVLWDKDSRTIVSNESAEIIRMFNSAFDHLGAAPGDYYPAPLRAEIDALNARIYDTVNNGVYKAGFARTQAAYEAAVDAIFATLDDLEVLLTTRATLTGDTITEADWRLFTTLVRFDAVYYGHFKCARRRLTEYANLWDYTRALYQIPGIAQTVHFDHIRNHYYLSHPWLDPTGIVPVSTDIDFTAPAKRRLALP